MIASIIPMTAGLLLDICGGFLIVKLFLTFIKNSAFYVSPDGDLTRMAGTRNFEDDVAEHKRQKQAVKDARYGFTFLAVGFGLILFASLINYWNSLAQ